MSYMKSGSPFLYDDATGDIVGLKDKDGSEKSLVTMASDGIQIGGAAPTEQQRAAVRAGIGDRFGGRKSISVPIGDYSLATVSAAASVTRGVARVLEFDIGAIKARAFNIHTSAIAGCKAIASVVDGAADPYGSTAVWSPLNFSGSATFELPAGSGAAPSHEFGVIDSDMSYISGNAGQLLLGRVHVPSANNTRFEHPTRSPTLADDGILQSYYLADGVTDPATYVPVYHNTGPALHWLVYPKSVVKSWVACGASTAAGQGDTVKMGWVRRAQELAEADGTPIAVSNYGHSGSPSLPSLVRGIQGIQLSKPDYATWHPFSTNDSPALTDIPRLKGQALQFIDACVAVGTVPVLVTFQPNAIATGDALTVMQSINQYCRELAAGGWCDLLDFQLLFSGSTTGTTWAVAGDTTDGTHPNAQGHAKAALLAMTVIQ